jgi:hypothetical protein
MNTPFFLFIFFIVIGEIVLAFVFSAIAQLFYQRIGLNFKSILKGAIERLFLTVSMLNNYPHALTLFSALKLATRLKRKDMDEEIENKFNDFYLVGNMVSVVVAMGYVYLFKEMMK